MILVYDEHDKAMLEGGSHYAFSKSLRNKIESKSAREKMPAKWFLDPKNKKFPYVNPDTKKPDCRLIKAAMVRSGGGNKAHKKFPQIHAKAVALWNKYCSKKKKESFDANIDYAATEPMLESDAYSDSLDVLMESIDRLDRKIEAYCSYLESGELPNKAADTDTLLESEFDDLIDDTALLEAELDMLDAEVTLMEMETSIDGDVLL